MTGTLASIQWRPHIGDPTLLGWIVTCLYGANALLYLYQGVRFRPDRRVVFLWTVLGLALAFLALNKQWDLQMLFTQMGRSLAQTQGWLPRRRLIQAVFVIALSLLTVTLGFLLYRLNRRPFPLNKIDRLGWSLLGLFLLVRMATDYHVLPALPTLTASLEPLSLILLVIGRCKTVGR